MPRAFRLLALALVTSFVGALAFTELADGDLGFHLATGRYVLAHAQIPQTNVLSYTNPDYPWHLHQWLPGVLFEWTWQRWGLVGLSSLKIALVIAVWLTAYAAARATATRLAPALSATLLAASAAAFRFELRPFLFTHLALAAVIVCAACYLRCASEERWRDATHALLGAAVVPVIACHLHAGVIDSWLVLAALAASAVFEPVRARLTASALLAPHTKMHAVQIAAALLGSIALGALSLALYHPIGARILLFPFDMGSDTYLAEHLIEFRPPTAFPIFSLAPYWLVVLLVLASLASNLRRLHVFWPLVTLGFLLLSLRHVRLAFGFAIVSVPVLAVGAAQLSMRLRRATMLLAVALIAVVGLLHRYSVVAPGWGFAQRTFPSSLFDYIASYHLRGPDFVSDAWAAPLLGRAYPERKAFFDNRFEAYPRRFYVDVYQRIRYGQPGWDALLDRYGVELVLLRYTSQGEARFQHGEPNLRQRLVSDPRWTLVTFDDLGMLALRTDGANRAHVARWSIAAVDPDRMRFIGRPRNSVEALRRELARGNDATRLLLLTAIAERDAGRPQVAEALLHRAARRPEAAQLLYEMSAPAR